MGIDPGTYIFTNIQYSNSKLDLWNGSELAPVTGLNTHTPQKWVVESVTGGSVNIHNSITQTSYVSVHKESANIGLMGSTNPHKWVAQNVFGERDTYYFTNESGDLVWTLQSAGGHAVVALKKFSGTPDDASKWEVVRVQSIKDGEYTFTNVKYPNSKAALFGASGPIIGSTNIPPQKWTVKNVGNDQITVENVPTPNSYAFVSSPSQDNALTGSTNALEWAAHPFPGLPSTYYFTTVDGKFVWTLPADCNYVVIILQLLSGQIPSEALWKLD